jgi:hypothetical protein
VIHKVFTIYDSKALAYLPPFFVPTVGMGVRMFKDAINDKEHPFYLNKGDYTLYEIGEYDDNTGTITTHAERSHGNGLQFAEYVHTLATKAQEDTQ